MNIVLDKITIYMLVNVEQSLLQFSLEITPRNIGYQEKRNITLIKKRKDFNKNMFKNVRIEKRKGKK